MLKTQWLEPFVFLTKILMEFLKNSAAIWIINPTKNDQKLQSGSVCFFSPQILHGILMGILEKFCCRLQNSDKTSWNPPQKTLSAPFNFHSWNFADNNGIISRSNIFHHHFYLPEVKMMMKNIHSWNNLALLSCRVSYSR